MIEVVKQFFYTERYDKREVKMVFRGWIKIVGTLRRSKWVQQAIQKLLEYYHEAWSKRNEVKFGSDVEAGNKLQKDQLLEQIYDAYETRYNIFWHEHDTYDTILFRLEKEKWESAPIKNMQTWLKLYRQAVNQRRDGDFNFNVGEYFQFAQVSDSRTFGDID